MPLSDRLEQGHEFMIRMSDFVETYHEFIEVFGDYFLFLTPLFL